MPKQKNLAELNAKKDKIEQQLAQERHKIHRLENRAAYYEKGDRRIGAWWRTLLFTRQTKRTAAFPIRTFMSCVPFALWTNTADGATSSGKDKWILDEDAAQIVKRVFDLCIDGKGPEQISWILERDHVEIPALAEPMIAESTLGRKKRRDLNGHAVLCPNRRTYSSLRRLSLTLRCFLVCN